MHQKIPPPGTSGKRPQSINTVAGHFDFTAPKRETIERVTVAMTVATGIEAPTVRSIRRYTSQPMVPVNPDIR